MVAANLLFNGHGWIVEHLLHLEMKYSRNGMYKKRLGAILILIALAAYIPAMRAGFIWDDNDWVTENQMLRTLDGLRRIWVEPGAMQQYYPLSHTSFWIEYHLWELHPFVYHLDNVLLHAFSAVILWLLLLRLSVPGAWVAAAIFTLHPVHVESVAWITERKNVLSGFFYLSALLAYLGFSGLGDDASDRRHPPGCEKSELYRNFNQYWSLNAGRLSLYFISLILFVSALLSKTVTCSMPVMILLLLWWKRDRVSRRDALAVIPFFVIGAGLGILSAWVEKHYCGAAGEEWAFSFVDRILIAGRALWFYAGRLFWPHKLTFVYPRWQIDSGLWWQYVFPLAAVAVILALWLLRRRMGKAPLVAVLYFTGTLIPALGFFDVYFMRYSFVADHWQYLASIGLIVLCVGAIGTYLGQAGLHVKRAVYGTCTILLLILGILTWRQGYIYRDLETLWRDTLTKSPNCWMAHNNLGNVLVRLGESREAAVHYREALRIKPDFAKAHYNLGGALANQGKLTEAVFHYTESLRIKPDYSDAHCNIGVALAVQGEIETAIAHFTEALRLKPENARGHNNLGIVLAGEGKFTDAIAHYREALRIKPGFAQVHFNLGMAFLIQNDRDFALREYKILKGLDENLANKLFNSINE